MTDRELLEFAAKAAGIMLMRWDGKPTITDNDNRVRFWNPLEDDGDALRLAVTLRVLISVNDDDTFVAAAIGSKPNVKKISKDHGDDRYAATRRAIARVAAEIGKGM